MNAVTGATLPWSPVLDDLVLGLTASGSTVFAAGGFSSAGGAPHRGVAAINGATGAVAAWRPALAFGGFGGDAYATALSGRTVVVGATNMTIAGRPQTGLAGFDAITGALSSWKPIVPNVVEALATSGGTRPVVYAGGGFTTVGPAITGPYAQFTSPPPTPPPPPQAAMTLSVSPAKKTVRSHRRFSLTATARNTGAKAIAKVKVCETGAHGLTVALKRKPRHPVRTACAKAVTLKPGAKRTLKVRFRAPRVHAKRRLTVVARVTATGVATRRTTAKITVTP